MSPTQNVKLYTYKCTGFEQTFEGPNLQMLNTTFECLIILHYIMEYVGNLCNPCP